MEIKGVKIGLTPEDKEVVVRYLKPVAIVYGTAAAKKLAGAVGAKVGPKVGLKVVRIASAKLEPTDKEKLKFIVGKAKDILEKPEKEKLQAKADKIQAKIDKKANKPIEKAKKKRERRKKKLAKLAAKGKLPFKRKLVTTMILRVAGRR